MKNVEPIYRIIFTQKDKTYQLYARYLSEETMMGFIELKELIFSDDGLLIDTSEEKLKAEFKVVEVIYIPLHSILRIDKMKEEHSSKIQSNMPKSTGNVHQFPKLSSSPDQENE